MSKDRYRINVYLAYFLKLGFQLSDSLLVGKTFTLHDRKPKLSEPKDCFRVKGGLCAFKGTLKSCRIPLHVL